MSRYRLAGPVLFALALGVAAYFDKPLRISDLRTKVQEILGPSSVHL